MTYPMVQNPSWEANWFAASQEIPRISRNPKVHYRTHKRPPPVSIMEEPNPVHIPTSHPLEIHPNIIHPSMPRSPQRSLSLRFPHQDPIQPPLLTHTHYMPSPPDHLPPPRFIQKYQQLGLAIIYFVAVHISCADLLRNQQTRLFRRATTPPLLAQTLHTIKSAVNATQGNIPTSPSLKSHNTAT